MSAPSGSAPTRASLGTNLIMLGKAISLVGTGAMWGAALITIVLVLAFLVSR